MTDSTVVALCADKNIEVGLHVTLHSLVTNSLSRVKIFLVLKGYGACDIQNIHRSLENTGGDYELIPIAFDDQMFKQLKGLHGNTFAYTRMMLPQLLDEPKVIYLDSDLVVNTDLTFLFKTSLEGCLVGASGIGNIEWALEKQFFLSLGMDKSAKYFNSGVLLLDLDKWRNERVLEKCLQFANKYPRELSTADQTILNYIFYPNNFLELPEKWNCALYPNSDYRRLDISDRILHFVGSPKPWDLGGEFLHASFPIFEATLKQTYFKDFRSYKRINMRKIWRTLRLMRSYWKNTTFHVR